METRGRRIGLLSLLLLILVSISCQSEEGEVQVFSSQNSTVPSVSSVSPADNSSDVPVGTEVEITFSMAVDQTTVTTNTSDNICSGSVQLSSDSFSSCVMMASDPTADSDGKICTVTPSSSLLFNTVYQIKVTTDVADTAGNPLAAQYLSTSGFMTVASGGGGSLPVNAASAVSFSDTDLNAAEIGGAVSITKAADETDLTHYVLYWGSGATTRLTGQNAVATLAKTGSDLTYSVPADTSLPSGATHFLVFTKNPNGEMSAGVNTAISDASDTTGPSITIQNLRNNGVVRTGFIIGTASDTSGVTSVEVKIDTGSYSAASGTTNWKFQLPVGTSTWKQNSRHTITVRAIDAASNPSSETSISVVKGTNHDVNGDGYEDIVIGEYYYNGQQGRAYVFHGGASGIADQDLGSGGSANTTLEGEATSRFGSAVAMGDVNGDGYTDVIVAANQYVKPASTANGRVYIFHGGASGISDMSATSANSTIIGNANTKIGEVAMAGDTNGDGYADLAISSTFNATNDYVYIFHGSASGIPNKDLNPAPGDTADTTLIGEVGDHNFGYSLAMGNVNGDNYADIAVGSSKTGPEGDTFIFHGSASGVADQDLSGAGTADTTIISVNTGDRLGYSIDLSDVNGDDYSDLIAGAALYNAFQGVVYIFHGSGSGIADQDLSGAGTANTTLIGTGANDSFGSCVIAGDTNGDGYTDVMVGDNYNSLQGKFYLFYGGSSGVSDQDLSGGGSANSVLSGASTSSSFGKRAGFHDVNGDGYADFVPTASGQNTNEGQTYIFHGGSSGIATGTLSSTNTFLTGTASNNYFGIAVNR